MSGSWGSVESETEQWGAIAGPHAPPHTHTRMHACIHLLNYTQTHSLCGPARKSPWRRAVHQNEYKVKLCYNWACKAGFENSAVLAERLPWASAAQLLEPKPRSSAKHLSTRRSLAAQPQLCQHPCETRERYSSSHPTREECPLVMKS